MLVVVNFILPGQNKGKGDLLWFIVSSKLMWLYR